MSLARGRGRALIWCLLAGLLLMIALASRGATAPADPAARPIGSLDVDVRGEMRPRTLPARRRIPVMLKLGASVVDRNFGQAPSLLRAVFSLDPAFATRTRRLGHCSARKLADTRSGQAKRLCSDALIGQGHIAAVVQPEDQRPVKTRGPLLLFNGPGNGRSRKIVVHAFAQVPVPSTLISEGRLRPLHHGRFGTRLSINVPQIGGADGSVTAMRAAVGRSGRRRTGPPSFLRASCPRGRVVGSARLAVRDGNTLEAGFIRSCRRR